MQKWLGDKSWYRLEGKLMLKPSPEIALHDDGH
jgi:hypothetical protein